ncbi:MAG TPA: NF038122 family metalloprotease [Blastocatellia bacterium]|nr:NF038122 family metalloprotease [Blastocatellia bacterium]
MALRSRTLARVLAGLMFFSLAATGLVASRQPSSASSIEAEWTAAIEDDVFVYYEENGEALCRPASAEEARALSRRDENVPLHVLEREGLSIQSGGNLNIVLRGTQQLESFPQAKEAFLRAAERWKSLIEAQTPITIIIDVDYGPTRFGHPFPSGVLGSTSSQSLGSQNGYASLRNALVQRSSHGAEAALYNALPQSSVPTDLGQTTEFVVPSPLLRALGLIAPVADPQGEQAQFGPPPSIGFNSNFAFDFDPSDGIDADKTDFDAVAVHEIGHLLGFTSRVGMREIAPSVRVAVSVLDLLRFRPGVTLASFTTAQRPLSSGGEHMFFAGLEELPLSTGRPDGSGGDGNQPSHWKDSIFLPNNIGIMDPRLGRGERVTITDNDLHAYDAFGYTLRSDEDGGGGGGTAPAISSVAGDLQGDMLTLTGAVSDPEGDIAQAEVSLLDGSGSVISQTPPVGVSSGGSTAYNFSFQVNGLNDVPAALQARLVFIDSQGNRSAGAVADFSKADAGGPNIKKVVLKAKGSKLVIKGSSMAGQVQVEVNGVIVAAKNNGANGKVKIGGNLASFNIRSGANRVRVIRDGLRSNIAVANF